MARHEIDLGKALADRIRVEAFIEEFEKSNRDTLLSQLERAEEGFRLDRSTPWDEVKRRNEL